MASIGNLVVNMTAKTDKFRKGMASAQQTLKRFAKVSLAIGAVGSIGLIKLAADAEQLEVKFRVLLKSGDAAKQMMLEIGAFAASTPFQKMDIAEAGQKLLAFNVPANKVMGTLKNIGDISALTGNRIGELAELYGKANVQGRLFAEDINQLTGRGIPIIQELAKQFGVAESGVRGLVEAGQVSARNIEIAFADMTAAGGQFADGMAQLSATTAGRFSTLKDNITELGATMGKMLLPVANKILSTITALVKITKPWGETIMIVGSAVLAASGAIWIIVTAMGAYAKALVFVKALGGPKAWAMLAFSLTVATGAMVLTAKAMEGVREESAASAPAAAKAASEIAAIGAASKKTATAITEVTEAQKVFAKLMQELETPIERVESKIIEFTNALIATKTGIVWDRHPLVEAMREKETGFTTMLSNLQDELKILRGEATKTGIKLAQMAEMGVDPAQVEKLRKLFAERDAILAKNRAAEEWRNSIGKGAGVIAGDTAVSTQARKDGLTPSHQRGTTEALTAIMRSARPGGKTAEVAVMEKVEKATNHQSEILQKGFDKITAEKENMAVQGAIS